jgi:alpha-1,2-mannosyltransferase
MTELIRRSTPAQRLFFAALLALFVVVSIQYHNKVEKGKSAINRWAPQIQQIESGEDINRNYNYPNPPIMALILWPISELITVNAVAGALVWFYLKVAMAIASVLWVFKLVETPERPFPAWGKALTVALSIRPIVGDLSHGNVNIFILFLVVASLYAFSRGRDYLSGIALALAIACKVTPALFVAYFVWKGAWRVLLGTAAGLALFFLFVPAAFLGWEQNLQSLKSWIEVMILPYVVGGYVTPEHNNQSLPGLIARLFTYAPSFSTYIGDYYIPLRYDNMMDIGSDGAKWLVKGFMGLFALLVMWKCRTPIRPSLTLRVGMNVDTNPKRKRGSPQLAAEYSLICVGMLLFSERTWKHHCVTLLLPFAVLCYGLANADWSRRRRSVLLAIIVGATLLMATTSTGLMGENIGRLQDQATATSMVIGVPGVTAVGHSGIWTDHPGKIAQVYGAYVWAFFLLIGGLAMVLRREKRASESAVLPIESPLQKAA